ncbi:hypothetical protein [Ktedonobacter racemifer]|uniref:Uncharacterized protein n=1 Tax=Ktedonobacter racemifer DSM 44963 TaxID=485913 RepID=D6TF42_KTERA|nr:hypothetical protein [Ktedonobacter racemifer]EFH90442.1 hypothetical protein Krac_12063 [Ktedonobacter racemifer DSM 44963]
MLRRFLLYRSVWCGLGVVCLVLGILGAINVVLTRSALPSVSFSWILSDLLWWPGYIHGLGFGGVLTYIGIGIFLLGISSGRGRVAYWCLQAATWCAGLNTWYQHAGSWGPGALGIIMPTNLLGCVITLACSLALLAAYIPITRLFRRLLEANSAEKDLEAAKTTAEA